MAAALSRLRLLPEAFLNEEIQQGLVAVSGQVDPLLLTHTVIIKDHQVGIVVRDPFQLQVLELLVLFVLLEEPRDLGHLVEPSPGATLEPSGSLVLDLVADAQRLAVSVSAVVADAGLNNAIRCGGKADDRQQQQSTNTHGSCDTSRG